MKFGFKVKALVAGAMMLVGGAASANLNINTSTGDIFLNLWDQTTGTSYEFDTGLNQSTFSSTGNYSFSLSGDTNYSNFLAAVGTGDTVTYNLVSVGAAGFSTSNGAPSPTPKNGGLNTALSNVSTYAQSANSASTTTSFNSSYATGGNTAAAVWGSADAGWGNNVKTTQNALVGTALGFYSIAFGTGNHSSNFVSTVVTPFASTWLLTNAGNLTYGAVPIPAPFGLLLGGLALMGVIARRKPAAEQDLGGAAA